MFDELKGWFSEIQYPKVDGIDSWINEISVRLSFYRLYEITSDANLNMNALSDLFRNYLDDTKRGINYNEDSSYFEGHYSPIKNITVKELCTLNVLAATTPSLRNDFHDAITMAFAFSDSEIGDEQRKSGERLSYSLAGVTVESNLRDEAKLEEYDINEIVMQRTDRDMPTRQFISVNLSSSDNDLANAFKSWLKVERNKHEIKVKKDIHFQFDAWNRNEILKTFDLLLWCLINDIDLSHGQRIEVLFPNSDIDDDNFRKTILPRVTRIVSWSTLDQLKSLTQVER